MQLFLFVLLLSTSCLADKSLRRIYNAKKAGDNEFPYLVKITTEFYCGGALISDKFVLTAAHCLKGFAGTIWVTLGDNGGFDSEPSNPLAKQLSGKMNFWTHEKFTMPSAVFDIGMIELPSPVTFSKAIQPIKISTDPKVDLNSDSVVISGFGRTENRGYPPYLLTEKIAMVPIDECMKFQPLYVEKITKDHICAAGRNTEGKVIGPCDGDSGSPLVLASTNEMIGVTSYVVDAKDGVSINWNDCENEAPSVYTRVASYLDWIHEITGLTFE